MWHKIYKGMLCRTECEVTVQGYPMCDKFTPLYHHVPNNIDIIIIFAEHLKVIVSPYKNSTDNFIFPSKWEALILRFSNIGLIQ